MLLFLFLVFFVYTFNYLRGYSYVSLQECNQDGGPYFIYADEKITGLCHLVEENDVWIAKYGIANTEEECLSGNYYIESGQKVNTECSEGNWKYESIYCNNDKNVAYFVDECMDDECSEECQFEHWNVSELNSCVNINSDFKRMYYYDDWINVSCELSNGGIYAGSFINSSYVIFAEDCEGDCSDENCGRYHEGPIENCFKSDKGNQYVKFYDENEYHIPSDQDVLCIEGYIGLGDCLNNNVKPSYYACYKQGCNDHYKAVCDSSSVSFSFCSSSTCNDGCNDIRSVDISSGERCYYPGYGYYEKYFCSSPDTAFYVSVSSVINFYLFSFISLMIVLL